MATEWPPLCTRREWLRLIAAAASSSLASCFGGPTPQEVAEQASRYSRDFHCTSTSGLFPAEIATRNKNEYTERSDNPLQYCFNCLYFKPAPEADRCGSCANVPGPIHPLGRCTAWTAKR